ncbi:MFS transporter [Actinomadura darangshiensis]|uniref:MFS transporter n=1 Tax=Actinomadura darangshiensis TaxID=705336 RepID=UPI001FB5A716|nr:MFS transporter [Actinomadura darangshiensis]
MVVRSEVRGAAYRWRWVALGALLVAEAMNLLDATIVQVAGPVIHADLGGAASDVQWFSAAYTLPFAVLLVTGGRLGDMLGRRRVFTVGVLGFVLASVFCAVSPGAGTLIGARVVQGAAAALIIPQTIGLIRAMFDGAEMAKALGWIGPVMGLSAVCGPVLGSVLTHAWTWRAAFLVNVPLAAAVLAMAPAMREDRAPSPPRPDVPGTLLAVAGSALVIYPLIEGDTAGWPPRMWALLFAGAVVLVLFGFHQRMTPHPLVEPSLFRDRGFPAALATSTLFFAVVNGLTVVVVLQVQLGLGRDVLTAGLTLLPWSCALALSSWAAGTYLVPKVGPRLMAWGLGLMLAGVSEPSPCIAGTCRGRSWEPWPSWGRATGCSPSRSSPRRWHGSALRRRGRRPGFSTPSSSSAAPWASPSSAASSFTGRPGPADRTPSGPRSGWPPGC